MKNYDFLKLYVQLQTGIMYDDVIDLGFALVAYSNTDKSGYWNCALINTQINEGQIAKIEETLAAKDRKSSIYFENCNDTTNIIDFIKSSGYSKAWEDTWQFWNGGEIDPKNFDSIKKVTNTEELKTFLNTFDLCYQKNDPQNPYGELGDYLKVAEAVWHKHGSSNRLEYFIVYKDDEPVAVSTLTNFEGVGYISNVGSLKKVRGEGFGKAATLYCISQSFKNGNTTHCLATEEGAYPNEFYKRIGFITRFTALGFTKK